MSEQDETPADVTPAVEVQAGLASAVGAVPEPEPEPEPEPDEQETGD